MEDTLLHVSGLRSGYIPGVDVITDVSLAIGRGEVVALLGRNGAGKSTLIRTLSGQLRARAGTVRMGDTDLSAATAGRIVRAGIATVPEGRRVFATMTVQENLILGRYSRRRGLFAAADLDRVFTIYPRLAERRAQLAGTLSGGEQQMLAIGRALVTNPRLLILDEATEGLAPLIRDEIWACLSALRAAGQSVLVVDKYVEKLIALADRHTVIERGQVVWRGSSAELDADHGIWHRYLGI